MAYRGNNGVFHGINYPAKPLTEFDRKFTLREAWGGTCFLEKGSMFYRYQEKAEIPDEVQADWDAFWQERFPALARGIMILSAR